MLISNFSYNSLFQASTFSKYIYIIASFASFSFRILFNWEEQAYTNQICMKFQKYWPFWRQKWIKTLILKVSFWFKPSNCVLTWKLFFPSLFFHFRFKHRNNTSDSSQTLRKKRKRKIKIHTNARLFTHLLSKSKKKRLHFLHADFLFTPQAERTSTKRRRNVLTVLFPCTTTN